MTNVPGALPFQQGGIEGVISYPNQMVKEASGAF